VSVPDPYDGSPEKTKNFFQQLSIYFTARGQELESVESKIFFMLLYMRGGVAEVWAGKEIEAYKIKFPNLPKYNSSLESKKKIED
jgi:hypothetical protein